MTRVNKKPWNYGRSPKMDQQEIDRESFKKEELQKKNNNRRPRNYGRFSKTAVQKNDRKKELQKPWNYEKKTI
jgi:hypothetical protein